MSFASVSLPSAAVRWALTGPAGPHTDALVAGLVGAGVAVEPITAGTRYRLHGAFELLDVLAAELAPIDGFTVERETPPTETIAMGSTLSPSHPFRRSVTVHGVGAASSFIARAVDRRLPIEPIGVGRWAVSGRTGDLVAWLAEVWLKTPEEVHGVFGWTPESVAAEDSLTPAFTVNLPPVHVAVSLPDRRTTSEIARNAAGEIVQVVQLESSVSP